MVVHQQGARSTRTTHVAGARPSGSQTQTTSRRQEATCTCERVRCCVRRTCGVKVARVGLEHDRCVCISEDVWPAACSPRTREGRTSQKIITLKSEGDRYEHSRHPLILSVHLSFMALRGSERGAGYFLVLPFGLSSRDDNATQLCLSWLESDSEARPFQMRVPKVNHQAEGWARLTALRVICFPMSA